MNLNKRLKAIIYMIIASILFTTLNLFGKLSNEISVYMKAFISNITACIIISSVILKNKISFMGKKRNLPKKEDFLKKALLEAQQSFENAYKGLENVNDPDLIDSYIYEINAANLRYKVLLRDVKMLSENNNN